MGHSQKAGDAVEEHGEDTHCTNSSVAQLFSLDVTGQKCGEGGGK